MAAFFDIGCVVVNFNTAALSLSCVASVLSQGEGVRLVVVDNASAPEDLAHLRESLPAGVELLRSERNVGFAAGCNLGIARLLSEPGVTAVLLLNSDASADPGLLAAMRERLDPAAGVGLVGAPMRKTQAPDQLDSCGIAFYASCLASNRLDTSDPCFGPTGGCALIAREVLERLQDAHGEVFAEDFFCYAEDTDLAARALHLGYRPAMIEDCLVSHEGQASSDGAESDFVLYHGIRNSIWMVVRNVPGWILLTRAPLILALHAAIVLRHGLRGRFATLWALYRDAFRGMGRALRQRRRILGHSRLRSAQFATYIAPSFYERSYVRMALRELVPVRFRGRSHGAGKGPS